MEIDRENLAISALCRELAKVFSGEISDRDLPDMKTELLARLRDAAAAEARQLDCDNAVLFGRRVRGRV
ncbi:hypothetical protein N2605_24120 [Bradyrhizobium yuanmingense]|uniref:hypothetical protein n=1 Tax=Bradyrhizobium TaxID=374 RepID=UPI001CD309D4|nr:MULTISPECIES: hypothetical protein [unclassified Bradyrhizobium]MCA1549984.1 hypothetical protein [Bradyrhizobium sp. BRP19]UWU82680.1 hypothetical protein N2605_24120 [Bradyrhizobium sp. CB1024]